MQRVMREGTGSSVYNVLPSSLTLAGKTGTSNDSRDSWFAGFSQDLLAVVWLGRDDNGKTPFTGATGALQVWTSFMRKADPLPLDMPQPDNVVQAWIDPHRARALMPAVRERCRCRIFAAANRHPAPPVVASRTRPSR
jgi:penicillin-binding protein 1B